MSKASLTRTELEQHLREQVGFIKTSADGYDKGSKAEAKRLALHIRLLVYDTNRSTSLLSQLELKEIPFCDTSTGVDTATRWTFDPHGLVRTGSVKSNGGETYEGGEYIPHCHPDAPTVTPKWIDFNQWWNAPILTVTVDENIKWLTRKNLVLSLSNQQGGAHVDPELDEEYARIEKAAGLGFVFGNKEIHVDEYFSDPDLASVRQIAHEVLLTLENSCPVFW